MKKEYVLMRDDDAHWYIVSVAHMELFNKVVFDDKDDPMNYPESIECIRINHPNSVYFTNYRIE